MTLTVRSFARIPQDRSIDIWNDLLERCPSYSFFQTPLWSEMLCQAIPGARASHHWFSFADGSEAVLPAIIIPKRYGFKKMESLPWGTYGDLIGTHSFGMDHRWAALSKITSIRIPVCELTVPPCISPERVPDIESGNGVRVAVTHCLNLSESFESVWNTRFQPRNRTAIRRARELGVSVRWSNGQDEVAAFRRLYLNACERWTGIETLPESFFDTIVDQPGKRIRVWLASQGEKVLSADVIFYGKGEVQYFAGANDREYSQYGSSKLLMSEIIRDACERRYSSFNFGGSGGVTGVEQFKKLFGAEEIFYPRLNYKISFLRYFKPCMHEMTVRQKVQSNIL